MSPEVSQGHGHGGARAGALRKMLQNATASPTRRCPVGPAARWDRWTPPPGTSQAPVGVFLGEFPACSLDKNGLLEGTPVTPSLRTETL